ncbi:MAG: M24 family metallopeptidase [Dehalococcoidia bacterium]|nr:M24 family metallopeptidase [Dehalococcoidia bacterium]
MRPSPWASARSAPCPAPDGRHRGIALGRDQGGPPGITPERRPGAIEDTIRPSGFGIVKGYGGHGVGRDMHEEPHVENFRQRFRGPELRPGLVIALEPMVTAGGPEVGEGPDGWTVTTKDGSLCCHFEHTIAIRPGGEAEVLTLP